MPLPLRSHMPEFEGASAWLNDEIKKADLVGTKPTLVHFWSISCGLCKEVMPTFNKLRTRYNNKIHVISVHMPRSEKDLNQDEVSRVATMYDMTQPIFIDNQHKLTDAYKNEYVPAYYLFDKEGKLRHFQAGGGGMNILAKRVDRVIEIQ